MAIRPGVTVGYRLAKTCRQRERLLRKHVKRWNCPKSTRPPLRVHCSRFVPLRERLREVWHSEGRSLWQRGPGSQPGVALRPPLCSASHARCRPPSADCGLQATLCCAQCPKTLLAITRFLLAQVPVAHRASPSGEQSQHPLLRQASRTIGSSMCCLGNSAALEQNERDVVVSFSRGDL